MAALLCCDITAGVRSGTATSQPEDKHPGERTDPRNMAQTAGVVSRGNLKVPIEGGVYEGEAQGGGLHGHSVDSPAWQYHDILRVPLFPSSCQDIKEVHTKVRASPKCFPPLLL
jgi:hypothetical protein